jgi:hypothetical protein
VRRCGGHGDEERGDDRGDGQEGEGDPSSHEVLLVVGMAGRVGAARPAVKRSTIGVFLLYAQHKLRTVNSKET